MFYFLMLFSKEHGVSLTLNAKPVVWVVLLFTLLLDEMQQPDCVFYLVEFSVSLGNEYLNKY